MKNIALYLMLAAGWLIACNSEKATEENTAQEAAAGCTYRIDGETLKFGWTAYKFNAKTPVKGSFTDIGFSSNSESGSLAELLGSVSFSFSTGSVNSNDPVRDAKIAQFFFGSMANTAEIKGRIVKADSTSARVSVTMNDLTVELPAVIALSGDTVKLSATIDLKAFNGSEAVARLNEVCLEKHTGEDGVSKLWDVVDIEASAVVKRNCP